MIGGILAILDWFTNPSWSWEVMDVFVAFLAGGLWIIIWAYALDWWDRVREMWRNRPPRPPKKIGRHAAAAKTDEFARPAMPRRELQRVED